MLRRSRELWPAGDVARNLLEVPGGIATGLRAGRRVAAVGGLFEADNSEVQRVARALPQCRA